MPGCLLVKRRNSGSLRNPVADSHVQKGFSNVGLQLDISGYRERREEALRRLAEKSAKKVIKEKRRLKLEPMNARERRIIHTSLKDYPEVTTQRWGRNGETGGC